MEYKVSLEKCSSYRQDDVDSAIKKILANLHGIKNFVKSGHKVLLKPNVVAGAQSLECATTNPSVVAALVKILKAQGCEVFVGDQPFMDDSLKAMKACGIYDACKKHGAKIVLFDRKINVRHSSGLVVKNFQLTSYFNEMDAIINLPKLKTHSQLYFTGAVKNLYSIMPGPRRGFYHFKYSNMEYFANMLLDLYSLIRRKVVLNVMDAVYGMEGDGPCSGTPKFAGVIGASSDAVALDFVMCTLAGLEVNNLPTNHYAKKRKDFCFDPGKIKILGENPKGIIIEPFTEANRRTLTMMPKFFNNFKEYITRHKQELDYEEF